uniref:WASH_WAHD domain-containing protein n=1 Tax=Haemonchus contortus TaxID=6289 RepID=U6NT07_HAECO|nr:Protein of unknown function DUF2360 domain containing protein [Haemonchus contortus]
MNEPDLSFIKSDIDLSEVAPLNRRRVVALVNCYIYKMIDFLNAFANRAEHAILEAERQLRAADIKLQLLEAKLASIPDSAQDGTGQQSESARQMDASSAPSVMDRMDVTSPQQSDTQEILQAAAPPEPSTELVIAANTPSNTLLVKDDPAFAKYFKMLKLGVVEPAVKLKMQSEGVDPSLLDNPNAPSPNVANATLPRNEPTKDTSDTSSVSSFSSDSD